MCVYLHLLGYVHNFVELQQWSCYNVLCICFSKNFFKGYRSSDETGVKPNKDFAVTLRSSLSEQTAEGFKASFVSTSQLRKGFTLVYGLWNSLNMAL